MLFNSPEYLFAFLPIALIVYFVLSRGGSTLLPKAWLVLMSLVFYGWWKPEYLVLLVVSITVNFQLGRHILNSNSQEKSRVSLIFGVVFNIGLLAYFKYANFIVDNFNWATDSSYGPFNIILPLAISFFTFQQIAYLADCYGDHDKNYSFLDYSLFVTFFPQLIAGPIVHHKEMMPQFSTPENLKYISDNVTKGLFIFSLGLFKKTAIADTFAVWASAGFDNDITLTFFEAWATSLSYTFQLYYDFSGYTDMAIGAALMFNILLPINFNSPYKALNIQDFWRRWHMTLSRWLKDYVYIPLGGNRCSNTRVSINLFLTFLIGGIWHGADWTFVVWGGLHGSALVLHRWWQNMGFRLHAALGWLCTFMFVNTTWVFFRAKDLNDALRVLKGMIGGDDFNMATLFESSMHATFSFPFQFFTASNAAYASDLLTLQFIVIFALIALIAPNTMQIANHGTSYSGQFIYKNNKSAAFTAGCAAGFSALLLFTTTGSEFLYFNF